MKKRWKFSIIFENIHRFFFIILDQFFGMVQIGIPYKAKNPIILANTLKIAKKADDENRTRDASLGS